MALPDSIIFPSGGEFAKQYLDLGNVYKQKERNLFFLGLKAQQVVDDAELMEARNDLGMEDTARNEILRLDFQKVPDYNYFFLEHDVDEATTFTAVDSVIAGNQVSGGLPIDFEIEISDRSFLKPGYLVRNLTTGKMYIVRTVNNATANHVNLRVVLGGTYSDTDQWPITFTNGTTSSAITGTSGTPDKFLVLGSVVQHGASTAIEWEPQGITVRQGRVQTTYEKYSKELQALMTEGKNLARSTDYNRRMAQMIYSVLSRQERSLLFNTGDYQVISSGKYFFSHGLLEQIGSTVSASALRGSPTVPTRKALIDITERISDYGGNYVLCVGKKMRGFVNEVLHETGFTYNVDQNTNTVGSKLVEVIGTFNNVPIVYNPIMNYDPALTKSIMALNVDNILLTTVENNASVALNGMGIEGDGILKTKYDLQNNEELIKADGVIVDIGANLVHQETHILFDAFSGVS